MEKFRGSIKTRIFIAVCYVILGAAFIIFDILGILTHDSALAFGIALVAGGAVRVFRCARLLKDDKLMHRQFVAETDERYVMIMLRARSLTFSIVIMLGAIGCLVLNLIGMLYEANLLAMTVCAVLIIYIAVNLILRKIY